MNKEQLIKSIQELPDQYDINLKIINNDIIIKLTRKVDEFEEYCSTLDDETFTMACSIFDYISDISLEKFTHILDDEKSKEYKDLFKKIVEFINANKH